MAPHTTHTRHHRTSGHLSLRERKRIVLARVVVPVRVRDHRGHHHVTLAELDVHGRVRTFFWLVLTDLLSAQSYLENTNNVEVFFVKENLLPFEIVVDDLLLLLDGLAPPMRLLKEHLHEVNLTLGHGLHLECHFLALSLVPGGFQPRNELVVIGGLGWLLHIARARG